MKETTFTTINIQITHANINKNIQKKSDYFVQ